MIDQILGPELSSIMRPFNSGRRKKKQDQEPQQPITPEVEAGIISGLKDNAVGGIEAIGNVLDLPGSSVRDLFGMAVGKPNSNPLDQWLPWNWTTSTNRTSGRQLARHAGLAGGQDTWGNFGAGLAVEVATDPFFWLPAGKAAQGAKAVLGTKPVKAATSAVAGTRAGKAVAGAANKGKLWWNQAFDSSVMGKSTERGQQAARELWKDKLQNEQDVLAVTIPAARELDRAGLGTPDEILRTRDIMEGVQTWDDPTGQLANIKDFQTAAHDKSKYWGTRTGDLEDIIDYSGRRMGAHVKALYGEDVIPGVHTPFGEPNIPRRGDTWKGFRGGTNAVNKLVTDADFVQIADKIAPLIKDAKSMNKAVNLLSKRIGRKYGPEVERFYQRKNDSGNLVFDIVGGKGTVGVSKHALAKYGKLNPDGTYTYTPANFGKRGAPITIKPQMVDRHKELASVILSQPEIRQKGIFTNDPIVDINESLLAVQNITARNQKLIQQLSNPINQLGQKDFVRLKPGEKAVTIQDMMKAGGLNSKVALERIAEAMNVPKTKASLKAIRNTVIDPEIAKDLLGTQQRLKLPVPVEKALNLANSFTSLFKAGVLTWPARHTRDLTSGMMRNWEQKMFSFDSAKMSHNILQGKVVEGAKDIPAVQDWLNSKRLPINDENATNALKDMYASMRAGRTDIGTDIPTAPGAAAAAPGASSLPHQVQTRKDFLSQVPGLEKTLDWKQIGRKFTGREPGTNLNPLNVRGVGGKTESTFGPVAASDQIGQYTDNMNRMTGFIELLKKGVRPEDAMKKVDDVQVSYHSRNFTPTENMLKTAFPFYSFSSRQVPYVGKELINNPGGRLGQTIRAANSGRNDDEVAPDYVSQSASIPLGGVPLLGDAPAGTNRYLTGLGLMFEDPLSFIGGGVRGAGAEAISRTTPWIKAPIEWASGESFFQRGPLGGRDLKDMDPLMGRIGKNVAQIAQDPSLLVTGKGQAGVEPYRMPFSEPVEFAAANSPLSRLLSTTRQLTDTRKNAAVKALNAFTGLRISDVDQRTRDAIVRELLQQQMREMGASEFTQTYFKEARKQNMSPEKQGLANLYQQFGSKLAKDARDRKKAQEAEQKQKELAYR